MHRDSEQTRIIDALNASITSAIALDEPMLIYLLELVLSEAEFRFVGSSHKTCQEAAGTMKAGNYNRAGNHDDQL